tara:strand:- start:1708 stop:1950 length:243 start_codon:yes stop_codon:yes gene_type:complete
MHKIQQLFELNQSEYNELNESKNINIIETQKNPIHLSHQTDNFGEEINPEEFTYNVTIRINYTPSSLKEACTVEDFLSCI